MRNRKFTTPKAIIRLACSVSLLLVSICAYLFWQSAHEPRHKGKPIAYWVDIACAPSTNQNNLWKEVVEIGPPALPYLIQKLQVKDTRWRTVIKNAKQKLPPRLAHWLPEVQPVTQLHLTAANILSLMGSNAEPAVPGLIKLVLDRDNSVDTAAVQALGAVGPGAKIAIPLLRNIATNGGSTSPHEQVAAAQALWRIHRETNIVLLVFQWSQGGPELGMLMNSTVLLSELGPAAAPATGDLVRILADTAIKFDAPRQGYVRGNSARALGRIGIKNDAIIEALLKASNDGNAYVKSGALWSLWALDKQYANLAVPLVIPESVLSGATSRTNIFIQRADYFNCDLASACEPLEKIVNSADGSTKAFAEQTLILIKLRMAERSKSK